MTTRPRYRANRDRDHVSLLGREATLIEGWQALIWVGMAQERGDLRIHQVEAYLVDANDRPLALVYEDGTPFDQHSAELLAAPVPEDGTGGAE